VTGITQARLHQLFDLNRETGELIWRTGAPGNARSGTSAGFKCPNGRVYLQISGKQYTRARLVYQYVHGEPLPFELIHKNGDPSDDRLENLRPVIKYPDKKITQVYLRRNFEVDYATGEVYRRLETRHRPILKKKSLGYKNADGHVEIDVLDQTMRRHQLVYLYTHGKLPKEINHINGILDDDRPENLRPATASQRNMHRRAGKLSKPLPKGVIFREDLKTKPFQARITVNGRVIILGYFPTLEEASAAYDDAAMKCFGEFARPNNLL